MPQPAKLILQNSQAPGDILMLTAAVRDLHRCHPGKFLTDVRTPFPDLWRYNLYLTPLSDEDATAERLHCHNPLIHRNNKEPVHFLHHGGFLHGSFLAGVEFPPALTLIELLHRAVKVTEG